MRRNYWKSKNREQTIKDLQEWIGLKQGEDGNLEIDEQCAYLGII